MDDTQKARARAKIFWEGGLKTRSIIRGFEVVTDKPKSSFGTNMAPAPMEVFISGIGSCILSTFLWAVLKSRITIDDCIVDIKAYTENHNNIEKISNAKISLTVWAESKFKNKLEQCFAISKTNCSLTNAVSIPIEIKMKFKENH